ncbi:hypothetical protein M5M_00137 [Simiduia agarivorans SA1 = DSM 21679]|uniref:Lipoprotein n=2 Tax=Simiduia TaxID=447467 RepID=R9S382_SIMAS|nr:hypothetical protein M5M_00137 [Simiduia agarivorans SA1 = DSM 21679]
MQHTIRFLWLPALLISACSDMTPSDLAANQPVYTGFPSIEPHQILPVENDRLYNQEAPIPPQCYTRTEASHNPCFVCHQVYPRGKSADYRMNKLDDGALQGNYLFSDVGVNNHWQNLFVDRRDYVAAISDQTIDRYVNEDNYTALAPRLKANNWQGYTPDLQNFHLADGAFDQDGIALDNSHWVAFNYKPFPSTFWPTNGSFGDVAIRLDTPFRERQGQYNIDIYRLNLALVEITIKDLPSISVLPFDESRYQIDINGDGRFNAAETRLRAQEHYFGDASQVVVTPQQYPTGTEFLHSVRYLGIDQDDQIVAPPRMKELRHMRKIKTLSDAELDNRYRRERKEKVDEDLPYFIHHGDAGMENGMGWMISAFVEDASGELRPQTHEENMACMGCHSAIGSTIDQTFSIGRKVTGPEGWGYINLQGMPDAPTVSHAEPEILAYFKRVGGGDEFRQNTEMLARWFDDKGQVKTGAVLAADVYQLITPSAERARQLNKAYTHIVRTQSYRLGRDATWVPAKNIHQAIDEGTRPLDPKHQALGWDLRLDWQSSSNAAQVAAE